MSSATPTLELSRFLEPFSGAVRAEAECAVNAGAVVVTGSDDQRTFRLAPLAGVRSVSAQLNQLRRTAPAASRVVWCLAQDPSHGLDGFEVSAVLGRQLHLELVEQVRAGDEKRVIAIGSLRREHVAISFNVAEASDAQLLDLLKVLSVRARPAAILFISAERLREVAPESALGRALAGDHASGGSLALLVPDAATGAAYANPRAQLAPFMRLGARVQMARFEQGLNLDPVAHDRFMRAAGLFCDSSMPIDDGAASEHDLARESAYAGPSPYRPQPFDLRVPWFQADPAMWIELPVFPLDTASWQAWPARLEGTSDAALADRLDESRMAAFFRVSRISPELERHYPGYRIYNWPRSAPGDRVWLLDAGPATVERVRAVDAAVQQMMDERRHAVSLVGQDELLRLARAEVGVRYGLSSATAIEVQHASHKYLADVPRGASLRQDYAEFARFAAADLGDAVEIGSGYGVLAWALSARARRYVCIDLDHRMLAGLRSDLGQSGVVADAHRLPFATAAFDSVVANNVIEHLYDPRAGLQEIHRILRPGGRLFALLPFDALDSTHELPAHLWKIDQPGLERALSCAGFDVSRLEVINLHDLGVPGAFPSCHGFAAMVDARRPGAASAEVPPRLARPTPERLSRQQAERAGRVWPSVREMVHFERWKDRNVIAVGADPEDINEFRHFGATVTDIARHSSPWAVPDGSADLVYVFLTASRSALPTLISEIRRVLVPGGEAVAVFRNRGGLRFLARVGSYFGEACDLRHLAGPNALVQMADDDGASGDEAYVSSEEADRAFSIFERRHVKVSNLTRDDLASDGDFAYPEPFWEWLAETCGRFVMVRVQG